MKCLLHVDELSTPPLTGTALPHHFLRRMYNLVHHCAKPAMKQGRSIMFARTPQLGSLYHTLPTWL